MMRGLALAVAAMVVLPASQARAEDNAKPPASIWEQDTLTGDWGGARTALKDKGIAVNSVCPGWCRTEMGGPSAPRSVEEGAAGIVWLAADAPQNKTGLFWRDREVIPW